jgi:hypothetical protein
MAAIVAAARRGTRRARDLSVVTRCLSEGGVRNRMEQDRERVGREGVRNSVLQDG